MLIPLASRIFSVLFCGQLAAVAPGFWQIFKEADCFWNLKISQQTHFFLFWATAVDLKKKKKTTFLCSTIPHVCRMLSRKVDKVSKDVERTRRDASRWQRCPPAAELIRHSCHRRGLIWRKCHTVCKLQAARLLSGGSASYQSSRLIPSPHSCSFSLWWRGAGVREQQKKEMIPAAPGSAF